MEPLQNILTLLIADDDTAARESLEIILGRKYPEVLIFSAIDGRTALESFRKHLPDIVITDVIMPEMDGIKLAQEIRSINDVTKLIILTGLSDLNDFNDSSVAGITFDHTMLKPVDLMKLFAAIDQCIFAITAFKKRSCRQTG